MSTDWQADVREFMVRFGQPTPCDPFMPELGTRALRVELIAEEAFEVVRAIEAQNLPATIDGCIDLIYVTLGLAVTCGVDLQPIWDKIHANNMVKEPYSAQRAAELRAAGEKVPLGKVMKPVGWKPVDVEACILEQLRLREKANANDPKTA